MGYVRVHVDMQHVLSVQIHGNCCELSLGSEIDLSVVPTASAVIVVLKNIYEARCALPRFC